MEAGNSSLKPLMLALLILVVATQAVSAQNASLEITRAREKAKTTKQQYLTIKRLSEKGSASQKDVRDANLMRKLAIIDLSNLLTPEKQMENALLRGKIVLKYRSEELAVVKKLQQSGSVSQAVYRRASTAYEVAKSRLKAIQGITETQRKIQLIKAAKTKFEAAQTEHSIALNLQKSGSISGAAMNRAVSNLEIAKSELEQMKKSLGASAVQVRQ